MGRRTDTESHKHTQRYLPALPDVGVEDDGSWGIANPTCLPVSMNVCGWVCCDVFVSVTVTVCVRALSNNFLWAKYTTTTHRHIASHTIAVDIGHFVWVLVSALLVCFRETKGKTWKVNRLTPERCRKNVVVLDLVFCFCFCATNTSRTPQLLQCVFFWF